MASIIEQFALLAARLKKVPGVEVTFRRERGRTGGFPERFPDELATLLRAADGIELSWTFKGGSDGGRFDLPSLTKGLAGALECGIEEPEGYFLMDASGCTDLLAVHTGPGGIALFDGDSFVADKITLEAYFELGIERLFIEGWVDEPGWHDVAASPDFESRLARVRARLGVGEHGAGPRRRSSSGPPRKAVAVAAACHHRRRSGPLPPRSPRTTR